MPRPSTKLPEPSLRNASEAHHVPIIDKMMILIDFIQASNGSGATIGDLVTATALPRSTVYRILNTLTSHALLIRSAKGSYTLGYRLVGLAASVTVEMSQEELHDAVHPHLERLAVETGETCKFSVLDGLKASVMDVVQGASAMSPTSRVGAKFDLHAGAASKLLLAFGGTKLFNDVMAQPRQRYTDRTLIDTSALSDELELIRAEQLSHDRGEWNDSVHAIAAPVFSASGLVAGAISVTYFASRDESAVEVKIREPLRTAAHQASLALGHYVRG
ncbi:MAG: hypothetical protein B7Y98_01020 [Sphingomonas sp. 32-62-10]|nr:MAG: hypothetical protein B7Z43_03705 [Sphingomonas sp. 12-62-6]OYX40484.1 MAG: hypothetical protein B7Y98_01020 [Sphingomonas sp. 32-62-10]